MILPTAKAYFSSNSTTCKRYRHRWENVLKSLFGAGSIRFQVCLCIALTLVAFLFPAQVSARTRLTKNTLTTQPTLQVSAGFDENSRLDYWIPVQITLSNDGPDFRGSISATTYTSRLLTGLVVGTILPWNYQEPVILPHSSRKQTDMYVPFYESPSIPRGIIVRLSDSHGKVIDAQRDVPSPLPPSSLFIGILSDQSPQSAEFSPLKAVPLPDPGRSIGMASLSARTFPEMAEVLDNFDVIILDDFTTITLSTAQLNALQTWINQGGVLIEIGGPQWQRTLATLPPQLLPVVIQGTDILPAGTHLLPTGSPTIAETGQKTASDTLQKPTTISTAALPEKGDTRLEAFSNLETVLASGNTPLIVQAHQGQGVICYLAFDPTSGALVDWPGTIALWKGLLLRTLGDKSLIPDIVPTYNNGPGQLILREGLLQILQPIPLLPVWALAFLLLGYIIFIGPVRYLIVKRLKYPDWNWRILLSSAVVFSLLTYGFANAQKGASINSISITQFNQGGYFAHVTTFFSAFIPSEGNFQVQIPARSLSQPISYALSQRDPRVSSGVEHAAITIGQNETNVNLLGVDTWSLHTIVSEADQKLHGGLHSHLVLRSGILSGTVTNMLETPLSDVYILMPHSFAYIDHLPAGQTSQVNVALHSTTLSSGTTLADQIASDSHLSVPYFPYGSSTQPQNDFQRHLAILTALSGEGYSFSPCSGPCSTHAFVGKHVIITPPFGSPQVTPVDSNDPLLVAGAPVTLIGWADQPMDVANGVTINGASSGGTHDSLIQMPLNMDLIGSSNLPPGVITGQVIDAQGDNVQTISPNVYTMNTGSITFEYTLPEASSLQANSLTIAEPVIAQSAGVSQLQVRLYNWNTHSWDTITLNNNSFTTTNTKAYTSFDRHILLQVVNQNASLGAFLFGKPSLSLNDAVN